MVKFEWVDQTGGQVSSEEVKKKIRSQAMRSFRSRQRKERAANSKSSSTLPDPPRKRGRPPGKKSKLANSSNSTCATPVPDYTVKWINAEPIQRASPDSISTTSQLTRNTSVPRSPSVWSDDIFSNPTQIEQMVGFCASYLHWLRPTITLAHGTQVISKAWEVSQSSMLLAAACVAAVGDIDPTGQPTHLYKAKVLEGLNERMVSLETAASDETIAALMFLTTFELARGSREAQTHLQGLNVIHRHKFAHSEIPRSSRVTLEMLDVIQSVMFDDPLTTSLGSEMSKISMWETIDRLQCTLTAEQLVRRRNGLNNLTGFEDLLDNAFTCVRGLLAYGSMAEMVGSLFWDGLETFREQNCLDAPDSGEIDHVSRSCYHLMAILYNLVINRRPYRHPSNKTHVNGLQVALKSDRNDACQDMPFLHLLIVLVGLASSRETSAISFFKVRVARAVYSFGPERWDEVREFALMFITSRIGLQQETPSTSPSPLSSISLSNSTSSPDEPLDYVESLQESCLVVDPALTQVPTVTPASRKRVEELLKKDRAFHDVIKEGNCWLTQQP